MGAAPRVVIADVELAKEIMVKEFDNFRDRGLIVSVNALVTTRLFQEFVFIQQGRPNLSPKALGISTGLIVATGETWKTGRHALTPSFSGMKMKLVTYCVDKLPVDFNAHISHRWFHC